MQAMIDELAKQAEESLGQVSSKETLASFWQEYLSKNGKIPALMKNLRTVAPEERPAMGKIINELKAKVQAEYDAAAEGEKLGLTADELAFYDALTKPQAIKDFYEHDELIAITKELTDLLRKNQTIDWQKKESARAGMRRLVKRLLKKHKYPPEGMDDAVQTVMSQCEMWVDNC